MTEAICKDEINLVTVKKCSFKTLSMLVEFESNQLIVCFLNLSKKFEEWKSLSLDLYF